MENISSRSRHRRGPRAAPVREPALPKRPKAQAAPYGGFPMDLAQRHLSNFYRNGEVPDARDLINFRTTRALVVAARRWRKLANDRIKGIGQSMARWETLYLMAAHDEDLSQGELAQVVGVEGPTMVSMLNSLAKDGLIERQQSSLDRRVTLNRITEKGWRATRDIMAITNGLRGELLRDIDPDKLAITLEVLESIHARLDQLC
jgi:MarR family transcriptional regulator for hemolysin